MNGKAFLVKTQKQIKPDELIAVDLHTERYPIGIDLVYANRDHPENIFKTAIYHDNAKLWLYKDLAEIVFDVALNLFKKYNGILILKDGLRTVEAQMAMQETEIVKKNPHWSAPGPSRLLSPPGAGGHPRGMAIDVSVVDAHSNQPWDMGTVFDHLTTDPKINPASRSYQDFSQDVLDNRHKLESLFLDSAHMMGLEILPLPSEWWDYRFMPEFSNQFAPLSDHDLPPEMRMVLG